MFAWPIALFTETPARDEERAVRVAEVMEAQGRKPGGVAGTLIAAAQRGRIEAAAEAVAEDVLVGPDVVGSTTESVEGGGRLVGERDLAEAAALGGVGLDVGGQSSGDDQLVIEKADVAPASTSTRSA
jgi:hypothetical protein